MVIAADALRWRRREERVRFDRILGLWEYGDMKTTLELPDELMRQVKLRAVHRNQKLKDAITQLLQIGIAAAADAEKVRRVPKPLRLKGNHPLTILDIEGAIGSGRE
jgi:hypothetical protein